MQTRHGDTHRRKRPTRTRAQTRNHHAIYADWIALVLEHNTGGALAEFGRADRPFLLDRTYVFPRGYDPHHDAATDSLDEVHARSIELAYEADGKDELLGVLETLIEEAATNDISLTTDDLTAYLEQDLGGRLVPPYSGVITDGIKHYERLGQCFSWTTEDDLRTSITNVP